MKVVVLRTRTSQQRRGNSEVITAWIQCKMSDSGSIVIQQSQSFRLNFWIPFHRVGFPSKEAHQHSPPIHLIVKQQAEQIFVGWINKPGSLCPMMAPRSLSHSSGSGYKCFWNNRLSGIDGSQTVRFTDAPRAIELKEKPFRACGWGWRRDGLGPDESHTRPDRVNGSLVKSVLDGGTQGVLTYQPLQTCLSVHRRPQLWLGRPAGWSQLSGLSAGERGILNSSVMLTGNVGWGKEFPECRGKPSVGQSCEEQLVWPWAGWPLEPD